MKGELNVTLKLESSWIMEREPALFSIFVEICLPTVQHPLLNALVFLRVELDWIEPDDSVVWCELYCVVGRNILFMTWSIALKLVDSALYLGWPLENMVLSILV